MYYKYIYTWPSILQTNVLFKDRNMTIQIRRMTKRGTSGGGIFVIVLHGYSGVIYVFHIKYFRFLHSLMDWFIFVEYFHCRLFIENLLLNLSVPNEAYSRNVTCIKFDIYVFILFSLFSVKSTTILYTTDDKHGTWSADWLDLPCLTSGLYCRSLRCSIFLLCKKSFKMPNG